MEKKNIKNVLQNTLRYTVQNRDHLLFLTSKIYIIQGIVYIVHVKQKTLLWISQKKSISFFFNQYSADHIA